MLGDDKFNFTAEKLIELSKHADKVLEISKPEEKNEFLEILTSNFTINQKNCVFCSKPFDFFAKTAGSSNALPLLDIMRNGIYQIITPSY